MKKINNCRWTGVIDKDISQTSVPWINTMHRSGLNSRLFMVVRWQMTSVKFSPPWWNTVMEWWVVSAFFGEFWDWCFCCFACLECGNSTIGVFAGNWSDVVTRSLLYLMLLLPQMTYVHYIQIWTIECIIAIGSISMIFFAGMLIAMQLQVS